MKCFGIAISRSEKTLEGFWQYIRALEAEPFLPLTHSKLQRTLRTVGEPFCKPVKGATIWTGNIHVAQVMLLRAEADLCKGGGLPEKFVLTFLAVQQVVELHVEQNFEDALQ
jgi:hypothetical protein